jgi:prophage maintenance system killer protein
MEEIKKGEIVIYKSPDGPELQIKMDGETVWLSSGQMAVLFEKSVFTINEHIRNIYKEKELVFDKTSLKQANVGKTNIGLNKPTTYYNLDVIISVGYRVKSRRGTQFRIWATQKLRDFIVRGYVVNEHRLLENQQSKLKELEQANKLFLEVIESRKAEGYEKELLKIITDYTNTWFVLNQYDKGELAVEDVTKRKSVPLDYKEVQKAIVKFRDRLMAKKEAGDLFGSEIGGKFQGVLGSINQTFGGKDLYPSLEEKAAYLLYFCVKDHPFTDGNKRIGSLVFLLYLIENHILLSKSGERKVNDTALAALALLIAESKPQQKEVMVNLVVNLINKK